MARSSGFDGARAFPAFAGLLRAKTTLALRCRSLHISAPGDRPGSGPFGSAAARPPPPPGDAKNGISKQGLESRRERDRHFAPVGRLRAIINL
jgi:hypothetical protein